MTMKSIHSAAIICALLSLPAVAQATPGVVIVPQGGLDPNGFEHPGTAQSPNPFGGLHMAHETDGLAYAFIGAEPTVERVELVAMPGLFTCVEFSQGSNRDVPCAHYLFPDGRTGPLGIADETRGTFDYSVAPRIEIDVISSINVASCMGTADACRQTVYFQVADGS
ncbi:hypothetical protein [Gymnodinialimonas ulvae]|uniref:hypothetical protein n=1 Tax=Gymnodinialimonas ulvae TaxID=3126504 RepID=UPI00309E6F34